MSDARLNLVIQLQDQMSGTLKNIQGGLDGVESKVKSMQPTFRKMAAIGTVSFAAVSGLVATTTKAFMGQEKAEARLTQIATQVTGATNAEIQGFKQLAEELQAVGVVGDEVIISGQSQIASFTKSADVVSMLSKDMADLAVAQYGTNVSQEEAIQTGNLLGKALQGQLGALTRAGILVNDEFKVAFENANTEQERAAILSEIIQDNYGGLNQAMRDTAEGGLQVLKNNFGDMKEVIGGALIPVINDLVVAIIPIVEKISAWVKDNQPLVKNLILIAGGVSAVVAGIGFLGIALVPIIAGIKLLAGLFLALTSPIGLVVIAVGLLAAAIFLYWDEIKEATMFLWEWFVETITSTFETIKTIWDTYVAIWTAIFKGLWSGIQAIFNAAKDILVGAFSGLWEAIKGVFEGAIGGLESMVLAMINGIIRMINKAIQALNKMGEIASKVPGVNIPNIPDIPEIAGSRATGGAVSAGQSFLVGERGAEIFTPQRSGYIIPNNKMGGGGVTVNINNGQFTDEAQAMRMADVVVQRLKLANAIS